jgi:hypothetical protein
VCKLQKQFCRCGQEKKKIIFFIATVEGGGGLNGATTLSITTFNHTTVSIMALIVTLSINDIQDNVMLSVALSLLCWSSWWSCGVSLGWMLLCWVSWRPKNGQKFGDPVLLRFFCHNKLECLALENIYHLVQYLQGLSNKLG